MIASLLSEVVGTAGLSAAAVVALWLTYARVPSASVDRRRSVSLAVAVCVPLEFVHFVEEYVTQFYDRFPRLLGLSPWSVTFFLVFNLSWFIVWMFSAIGIRAGIRAAFFPIWFLAIAMMMNGIAHPLLALWMGRYFSGLVTSPFVGVAGLWLWRRLVTATSDGVLA